MGSIRRSLLLLLSLLLAFVGVPLPSLQAAVSDYMTVTKSVNPTSISTEEEAEVTLNVKGTPPVNVVEPNDVILIIDKSGSMLPEYNNGEDKITAAKEAAKGFIDLMDFSKHRVGVVDFSSENLTKTFPLTTDAAAAKSYIDTIKANGGTATGYAIDQAIAELTNHRPEARPVIVILTDGDATEPKGNAYEYAKERAQAAKEQGIIFYTIALLKSTDNPDTSGPNLLLKEMATTAHHHHFVLGSQGLQEIYAAIVKEIGMASAYDVTVTDVVSPEFEIVPGSYDNNIPKPEVIGNTLTWKFAELKNDTLSFVYKIKPKDPEKTGIFPISKPQSVITYKDYAGANRSKGIPSVNLTVKYPAPIVTSIEKDYGHPNGGETVTIRGDKFRPGATVYFGLYKATNVQYISKNELTAVTPAGTQGTVTVKVTNPDGQQGTGTYQYKADPEITSVEPNNGPLAGGTIVLIKGNYVMKDATIKFGEKIAQMYNYASPSYFRVIAPEGVQPGPVDLTVTNPDGTTVTVPGAYTYNAPPVEKLTVTNITPTEGPLEGGGAVYIDGTRIHQNVKVYIGEKEAPLVQYYSDKRIKVQAPAGDTAGPVDVKVLNPDGESVTIPAGYTYLPPVQLPKPEITVVDPASGLIAGGTSVVVKGLNFVKGVKVYFGDYEGVDIQFYSSSFLTVKTPAVPAPGKVNVKVVNPDGQEAVKAEGFEYLASLPPVAPAVTSITPTSGPMEGGTVVYIDGSNFEEGLKVFFGSKEAIVERYYSPNRVKVTAPASDVDGAVDVRVVNPSGLEGVLSQGYTYIAPPPPEPPSITQITPTSGPMEGGTVVYIDGTNLDKNAKVYFGSLETSVGYYDSANRIKVTAPPSTVDGIVDVKVVNPDGAEAVLPNAYTYLAPPPIPAPVITNITPSSGPLAGNTVVYIDGSNFMNGIKVYFGNKEGTVNTVYSSNKLKAVAPAGDAGGPVDVKLVNPDGKEGIAPSAYTYIAPLPEPVEVTQITPNKGLTMGGEMIIIEGKNFKAGTTVTFGSTNVKLDYYYNSSKVRVKAPPSNGYVGPVDVTVINPDGESFTVPQGYTYEEPVMEITNVSPNHGPMSGKTVVYVDGKNFDPAMTVTIGGKNVSIYYYNTTRFKFETPASTVSGEVPIVVTLPSGKTATATFTYDAPPPTPAPTITKISPASGPVTGKTVVYLDGTGLLNGLKVYMDGKEVQQPYYYNTTRIKFETPPADGPGIVQIKIVNPDGQESNTIEFEYK